LSREGWDWFRTGSGLVQGGGGPRREAASPPLGTILDSSGGARGGVAPAGAHPPRLKKTRSIPDKEMISYDARRFTCSNCHKEGHLFRTCPQPITSYGIIAVKYENNIDSPWKLFCEPHVHIAGSHTIGTLKLLLICRRDSLSFIEFVRGKYVTSDIPYLKDLFKGMTIAEHAKVKALPFEQLWKSLWGSAAHTHKADYENSNRKYHQLNVMQLVEENPTSWTEPEWGFPKGRKNLNETDLQCAMREFQEETNLSRHSISLLQNVQPIIESFVGSNGVSYCHKYMIALCNPTQTVALTSLNPDMCREIGQIGWFTVEEALAKLRPGNKTKQDILNHIAHLFRTICTVGL
jgi:8-oxo-dGTP pyrophosphatase MutT (NUDIX family)